MASSSDITLLAQTLHAGAIRLLRLLRRVDVSTKLPAAQLSALSVLVFKGQQSLGELAREEQVSAPTMSRTCGQLVSLGLVERVITPDDRRGRMLSASQSGRDVLLSARAARVALLAGALQALSDAERESLQHAARLLLELPVAVARTAKNPEL